MLRRKPIDWCQHSTLQGSARLRLSGNKNKNKLGDRMRKQLLTSVIAKYGDLSVSRRSIICLSHRLRQIMDLLATDKSRYFAQPRPIIVNYYSHFRYFPLLLVFEFKFVITAMFYHIFSSITSTSIYYIYVHRSNPM